MKNTSLKFGALVDLVESSFKGMAIRINELNDIYNKERITPNEFECMSEASISKTQL